MTPGTAPVVGYLTLLFQTLRDVILGADRDHDGEW